MVFSCLSHVEEARYLYEQYDGDAFLCNNYCFYGRNDMCDEGVDCYEGVLRYLEERDK